MWPLIRRTGRKYVGAALVAGLCFGAALTASTPADARIWVGFNFGVPGWGYAPYYPAYYPYYGYYYPHRYWRHHYYRAHYWRHRNWCYWHPYRCRYW